MFGGREEEEVEARRRRGQWVMTKPNGGKRRAWDQSGGGNEGVNVRRKKLVVGTTQNQLHVSRHSHDCDAPNS